jgi:hypothetical protein
MMGTTTTSIVILLAIGVLLAQQAVGERNPKKGLTMHQAQSCNAFVVRTTDDDDDAFGNAMQCNATQCDSYRLDSHTSVLL